MDHEEVHKLHHESEEHLNSAEHLRKETHLHASIVIFAVIGLFFLAAIGAITYFLIRGQKSLEQIERMDAPPTPAVFSANSSLAFKELTIPYLTERNYESETGGLEQVSTSSTHTSYLTSYDSDGLNINALLTIPRGQVPTGGWPAIVFVHGYIPPSIYQTNGESYSDYVDYLARNGFIVFKIDLRGHGTSEGEPGGAYYSGDYIIDTLNAVSAMKGFTIAGEGVVNPEKIGLWGHSMAGNVTFRSFVAAKNIPALVIWSGAVYTYEDWQEFGLNDNSYRPPSDDSQRQRYREELFNAHGEFDSDSEFWEMVVPVNYLEGVSGAVQLDHAINDDVVNIGYSRGLSKILQDAGVTYELNEYSSGGHNITGVAFTTAMQDTVRFFNENLK